MGKLRIGWARRDISTDKPVIMPGQAYQRVSKGIHDPLYATVLALDGGDDYVIFISVDMVGFGGQLDTVREKVAALKPELDTSKVIVNATHTHAGGARASDKSVYGTGDPQDDVPVKIEIASSDEYIEYYTTLIAEAVAEAWDSRSEGGIAYGYGYAVVAHSRRVCYFDDLSKRGNVNITDTFAVNGTAAMYGKTNDDMFSHYEAGADHFINLLYTFDKDDKLTGMIVNVPCPSQSSEHSYYLSASFWNETRQMITEKFGDVYVLPQAACAGDLSPRILHYKDAQARRYRLKYGDQPEDIAELNDRRDIAERITTAVCEVYSWAKKDIQKDIPVIHSVKVISVARLMITDDEYEYAKKGLAAARATKYVETDDPEADFKENTRILSNRKRFLGVISRYEKQQTQKMLPMELHTIRVGDIAFATNPFELYMDYQHRMQARSPFIQLFCVELCAAPNRYLGTAGYLCTERGLAGKGYSAIIFSCQASPEGGQQYVEETLKELKELKDKY